MFSNHSWVPQLDVGNLPQVLDIIAADSGKVIERAAELWGRFYGVVRVSGSSCRMKRSDSGRPKAKQSGGKPSMANWVEQRREAVRCKSGSSVATIDPDGALWTERHQKELAFQEASMLSNIHIIHSVLKTFPTNMHHIPFPTTAPGRQRGSCVWLKRFVLDDTMPSARSQLRSWSWFWRRWGGKGKMISNILLLQTRGGRWEICPIFRVSCTNLCMSTTQRFYNAFNLPTAVWPRAYKQPT